VGRWAARYAEKLAVPHVLSTDRTDKRRLSSVLAVTTERSADDSAAVPAPALARATEAADLAVVPWTDADIARFTDRRVRLLRWGWVEPEAEKLAARLVKRDREHDDRVSCTDCSHYRPGRCGNHRRAGLHSPDVGRDLAALLQRCPGFQPSR
jgi:hypothetical protein